MDGLYDPMDPYGDVAPPTSAAVRGCVTEGEPVVLRSRPASAIGPAGDLPCESLPSPADLGGGMLPPRHLVPVTVGPPRNRDSCPDNSSSFGKASTKDSSRHGGRSRSRSRSSVRSPPPHVNQAEILESIEMSRLEDEYHELNYQMGVRARQMARLKMKKDLDRVKRIGEEEERGVERTQRPEKIVPLDAGPIATDVPHQGALSHDERMRRVGEYVDRLPAVPTSLCLPSGTDLSFLHPVMPPLKSRPDGLRVSLQPDGLRDGFQPNMLREELQPDRLREVLQPDGLRESLQPDRLSVHSNVNRGISTQANRNILNSTILPNVDLNKNTPQPIPSTDITAPKTYTAMELGDLLKHMLPALSELTQANNTSITTIQQQMLSRQTIAKKLDDFSGEIEKWPTFISQYRHSTEVCGLTNTENMIRLTACLKGDAKALVQPLLGLPENVEEIIRSLEMSFGRPELIVKKCIANAKLVIIPRFPKADSIIQFSNVVRNMVATFQSLRCANHMNNPQLLEELVLKLPFNMQMQWSTVVLEKQVQGSDVNIRDFSEWLKILANTAALLPVQLPVSNTDHNKPPFAKRNAQNNQFGFNVNESKKPKSEVKCSMCEQPNHTIDKCSAFKKLDVQNRWEKVKAKKLCFVCLKSGHQTAACAVKTLCGVNNCTKTHHSLLHQNERVPSAIFPPRKDTVAHAWEQNKKVHLRVLPVKLTGPAGEVSTFALLDDGSTCTMIDAKLATQLGLQGPVQPFCFSWTNNATQSEVNSMRVKVSIAGVSSTAKTFTLNHVRTVQNLNLPPQDLDMDKLKECWPYLHDVNFTSLCGAKPTLLIGQDNAILTVAHKNVHGSWNSPIATKTLLGWVVHGNTPAIGRTDQNFSFCLCDASTNDDSLHQLVKHSFSTESFGVKVKHEIPRSKEDTRGFELLAATTKRVGERWETGILWRNDDFSFPESKATALFRLSCVEKSFDKDPAYAKKYCEQMEDNFSKGYARKVSEEEVAKASARQRYLCHFSITNPNKPGKMRVVFDAKAKSRGVSFNDMIITGPDLLRPLPAVLWNFRKHVIAFTADIKEMFSRIHIRDADVVSQRFLWRGLDRKIEPQVYEMKSMIFGAACSPSSAIYVKDKNAEEFREEFPEVFKATSENFYMDDYLDGSNLKDQAIKHIENMIEVHRRGGFNLCNWTCSSKEVLRKIPEDMRASNFKDLSLETSLPVERVLGMFWDSEKDHFTYVLKMHKVEEDVKNGSRCPTKREVLKLAMSIFDPCGFISYFIVRVRILLQDIWATGIGWDDPINDTLYTRWKAWLSELKSITEIRIPRCYHPSFSKTDTVELHLFCDASEKAFACVAYFRIQDNSMSSLAIIAGKVKVAPLKPMSIPRLELQAAVMASRLAVTIKKEHDIKISRTIFWSDSKTVLCWIRSDSRRFKMFVGHRIGEIQELSDSKDWRWVPTKMNVADDATRDTVSCDLSSSSRWLKGPPFLLEAESEWPTEQKAVEETDKSEVKKEFVGIVLPSSPTLPDVLRFSSWLKLIRSTAWILRYIKKLEYKVKKKKFEFHEELSTDELNDAEMLWIRKSQEESFQDEIIVLKTEKQVSRSSRLYMLSPVLDTLGLLRIDGRINAADICEDSKHPFILDPSLPYTHLLIHHFHKKLGHQGQETMLNELRTKYWIIRARCTVKKIVRECQLCKNRKCKPVDPIMGQLPSFRITKQSKPFTCVGLDYFGPILVISENKRVKKYGVIFTCLTIRAVHLEIADNLTSDSTILAIRRFVATRGLPTDLYSDNGSNLRKANRELREQIQKFDQALFHRSLSKDGMRWHFNPPAAPHMGGAWERLIRSVKNALNYTMKQKTPNFEILRTVMTEAENIVNSRPLTDVSFDPTDPISLTPNHFLIPGFTTVPSLGVFTDKEMNLRHHWKMAQRLADHFWQRWLTEYLPTLIHRTKWLQRSNSLKTGDVVVVVDPAGPRNIWPLGRIVQLYPGRDGVVRVVDVKINDGVYRRSVNLLCVLDVSNPDEDST